MNVIHNTNKYSVVITQDLRIIFELSTRDQQKGFERQRHFLEPCPLSDKSRSSLTTTQYYTARKWCLFQSIRIGSYTITFKRKVKFVEKIVFVVIFAFSSNMYKSGWRPETFLRMACSQDNGHNFSARCHFEQHQHMAYVTTGASYTEEVHYR